LSAISFSKEAAQKLVAIYSTPDVAAQREAVLRRLALKMGERVIDVGCGPGFLCESMAAQVTAAGQVLGIDLSDDLVRFAIERKRRSWIDYRAGDAVELDVPSGSFDVAVSTQVIEYVPDADAAIREFYRVLRRGGRGVIVDTDWDTAVWHAEDAGRMARILAAWEDHCAHPRLPRTLVPRLRARGFVVERVEAYSIINTAHDPDTYSYGMARLIAEYLTERDFESGALDDWLTDLSDMDERGAYFFSINRYLFSVTKPGGPR
jgi:ubiquinone/menaquinone biosynthesis C-methylase UbiE